MWDEVLRCLWSQGFVRCQENWQSNLGLCLEGPGYFLWDFPVLKKRLVGWPTAGSFSAPEVVFPVRMRMCGSRFMYGKSSSTLFFPLAPKGYAFIRVKLRMFFFVLPFLLFQTTELYLKRKANAGWTGRQQPVRFFRSGQFMLIHAQDMEFLASLTWNKETSPQ